MKSGHATRTCDSLLEVEGEELAWRRIRPVEVLDVDAGMDIFESPYYRECRLLLSWAAQWPYWNAGYLILWRIVLSCVMISFFVVQVLKIIYKAKGDMNMICETLSTLITAIICFVKYLNGWINSHKVKDLLDRIREDWRGTMSKGEITIMHDNMMKGRLYAMFYIRLCSSCIILLTMRTLLPEILPPFIPLNISRFTYEPIVGYYLVSTSDYYLPIVLHITTFLAVTTVATMSSDAIFIAIVSHACGMFNVIGHRLERAFDKDAPDSNAIDKSHKAVVRILEHHKRTIEFVRTIHSCYKTSYVIQLFLVVIDFSILMLHLNWLIRKKDKMDTLLLTVLSVVVHFIMIFFNCLPGQQVLDSSAAVFRKAYCGLWYTATPQSQKILLLIMLRTMKATALTAANIFTLSFEEFALIIQSSMSYFMVLNSLQS